MDFEKEDSSFFTTGASTVEDADLTNSPMFWSSARIALLLTPNRLANSYTRALGTNYSYFCRVSQDARRYLMRANISCLIVRP